MQIQLKRAFSGRLTNEAWIQAGVYAPDDPALMGLAEYLVENGHAVIVGGDVEAVEPTPEAAQSEADQAPDSETVITMPSAVESPESAETYEHHGRRIKAGKAK